MRSRKAKDFAGAANGIPKGFQPVKATKKQGFGPIKTFLIGFFIFVLLLVPAMFGLSKLAEKPIFGDAGALSDEVRNARLEEDDPNYDIFANTDRLNILLLGVNGNLTDTIMLGSYNMKDQRADIISIPRDTYYERPDAKTAAQKRINAVYGAKGVDGAAAAVQDILGGIPINYYVIVEFDGVAKVIDAMGGVTVNIPIDMNYDDPYAKPPLHIHFKKGEQKLNGEDAVKFLRFRRNNNGGGYPNQDIGRTATQREFMKAAFKQAVGFSLPSVVKTVMENVDSDLTVGAAGKLALKAAGLSAEDITGHYPEGESGSRNGASYWFIDEDAVAAMIDSIYNPPKPEETPAETPADGTPAEGSRQTQSVKKGGAL
jgi:LCP family protein required for cell wall assembly